MNKVRRIDISRSFADVAKFSNTKFEVALLNKVTLLRILVVVSTVALCERTGYNKGSSK